MKIGVALPAQVEGVTRVDVLGYAERAERTGATRSGCWAG